MSKSIFICILFPLLLSVAGLSQSSTQTVAPTFSYHPPSADKLSWQRLNLWLSGYHLKLTSWAIGIDSSLIVVSRSLGISRLPVAAEGIENGDLLSQSQWFDQRDPGKGVHLLSQATGKKRLELMILLGAYYVFQNESYRLYKDSVEYFLKRAADESRTARENGLRRVALCLLGKFYGLGNDLANCSTVFTQLVDECRAAGDKKNEARAFAYRGMFTPYSVQNEQRTIAERLQDKVNFLDTAVKIYRELNDSEGEIAVLTISGNFLLAMSRIDEAYTAYTKALGLERSIGYPYIHYTTNILATLTTVQQKFGEPLKYALETVKVAESVRDSIGWGSFYDRLGVLYYIEGERQEESLKWMLKAINRHVLAKTGNVYQTLYNAAAVMLELGREKEALALTLNVSKKVNAADQSDLIYKNLAFANCYIGTGQFKLSEQYIWKADSIQKQFNMTALGSSYERTMVNITFSSLYFASGEFTKAKKYMNIYLADSTRVASLSNDITAYKQLISIDSAFKDDASAVKHYKLYLNLIDSSFRISKVRQAEELAVVYETEEKTDEIALLNAQAKVEQASLKQATTLKNVTIGGIVVALIIAGLLYRQSRLRKKNNKVITDKNELLQHFLTEKEWLLKEIHHRVKNNLQIVMSLLNSQSAYIDSEPALTAIHDSQHRVHAMSLIHQKLYGSENVSSIDMSFYIRELVSYLADSFDIGQRIRFEYNIEPLELDVSQAVPVGLILNEAITNSIKYAFPGGRNGVIAISLSPTTPNHYLLTISDNGIGMPPGLTNKKPGSLGMSLMAGLSEDLEGHFDIENNNGTTISISFLHELSVKRHDLMAASFVSNN